MRTTLLLLLLTGLCGCAPLLEERIIASPAAGVDKIPDTIALYPILSAGMAQPYEILSKRPVETTSREDRMYIVAPAETKLTVTMQSQLMTSLLSAELSRQGFSLKELPVEVPEDRDEGEKTFFVSLSSLKHLRESYGLKAVLVGNAYFIPDRTDPLRTNVVAAYLRVVDTENLDVLCHISLSDTYGGDNLEDVARGFAKALARKAGFAPVQ